MGRYCMLYSVIFRSSCSSFSFPVISISIPIHVQLKHFSTSSTDTTLLLLARLPCHTGA